jgi:dihydrofolate synthase/folylpolyglutamate synthase
VTRIRSYEEALGYLERLPAFHQQGSGALKPGLERIAALLDALGHPERLYRSVHIGGTNGKGSTSAMLAAIFQAAGYRVGLHTSPHLLEIGERMRVQGKAAPHAWIRDFVSRTISLLDQVQPSYFEYTVAMSLAYFAEAGVEVAVVEVGLGGRWDATNILEPELSIVTNVGTDHADILGPTVADIAREKAGIFKSGRSALTAARDPIARAVLQEEARRRGCALEYVPDQVRWEEVQLDWTGMQADLYTPQRAYRKLHLGLVGWHQLENAALAVRAAERLGACFPRLDEAAIRAGLAQVRTLSGLRGRLEVIPGSPPMVLDVAHNPEGVEALLHTLRSLPPVPGKRLLLFGVLADKAYEAMVAALASWADVVVVTGLPTPRALPPHRLQEAFSAFGLPVAACASVKEALRVMRSQADPEDLLLVCGSTYLVAELLRTFG